MQLQFNAQGVQPTQPFEPVPDAWYPMMFKAFEPKQTKANDGSWYLHGETEILDGQYKGRKVFINLNIGNKNPQAVEIAYRDLSAICHVTGKYVINDTAELLNIPFQGKVVIDGNNNAIKGYKDMNGNDPGKAGAPAPAAATMPAAMPPAAAPQLQPQGAWGQQPAAIPQQPAMQPQAGGWGAPPAAAPMAAPAPAQTGWAPPPQQQQPAGNAPWVGGAPTQQAPAPMPQGQPAWQPGGAPQGGGQAPWAR